MYRSAAPGASAGPTAGWRGLYNDTSPGRPSVIRRATMSKIDELLAIMARLRDPQDGCPWDREQTFASIVPHTLEEAYELAEAIERGDREELRAELGDLLFQVVFYSQLGREAGWFDFEEVVDGIVAKLVSRHPHVFGDASIGSAADQSRAWEEHKAAERARRSADGRVSALEGVPLPLPALTRAVKLQKRAARVGFDWADAGGVLAKIEEEARELRHELEQGAARARLTDEIGDLLFACANLARHAGVDAEGALRHANAKFERRFRGVEQLLSEEGREAQHATLEELDALWERVKAREREAHGCG
jgi:nucleoside triphosphate diphosphatase